MYYTEQTSLIQAGTATSIAQDRTCKFDGIVAALKWQGKGKRAAECVK